MRAGVSGVGPRPRVNLSVPICERRGSAAGITRPLLVHRLSLPVRIIVSTNIGADSMDTGQSYADIGELNRHTCRSIQS
jgi:hypothetical protein